MYPIPPSPHFTPISLTAHYTHKRADLPDTFADPDAFGYGAVVDRHAL
ncbi:MAG: hypothetical protein R2873_07665 [Caldilineaceae bacterium]